MNPAAVDSRAPSPARRPAEVAPIHRIDDDVHLGQFIPLHYHGQMLSDERRMSSFQEAILKLVPEGAHVVELGAGTGVMSFFASQRARKVTCIERLPHVAAAARRLLAANGAALGQIRHDRVTHQSSWEAAPGRDGAALAAIQPPMLAEIAQALLAPPKPNTSESAVAALRSMPRPRSTTAKRKRPRAC